MVYMGAAYMYKGAGRPMSAYVYKGNVPLCVLLVKSIFLGTVCVAHI